MPDLIKPHRLALDDRFSVMGFTVRTNAPAKWFEVALATDPRLFQAAAKSQRTAANFYSTRAAGALLAERNEAVYLVPAEVLSRFVGQPKLYYALATFADSGRSQVEVANLPTDGSPWIDLRGFTGRALRRLRAAPSRASNGNGGNAYGAGDARALEWAGDALQIGMQPVGAAPPNGKAPANGVANAPAPPTANGAPASQGQAFEYDDGFGHALWARLHEAESQDQQYDPGIEEPIPDWDVLPQQQAYSVPFAASEYSGATLVPAASNNYRHMTSPRAINRIVIHITAGGPRASGTAGWFQNPNQTNSKGRPITVSAHYTVGQQGEIIQSVKHNDVAWHASRSNSESIGIEHCAHKAGKVFPTDMPPTEAQYCESAALVNWLCQQYGIPMDRDHIAGHAEVSPQDNHDCPSSLWDWDYYMGLVTSASCYPRDAAPAAGQSLMAAASPARAAAAFNWRRQMAARPFEVVQLDYAPSNTSQALAAQLDFQNRYQQWMAGVPNTGFFPHSAICRIVRDDGGAGTGFYVGADRILTAAHVVEGANSLTIIPGKNGGTDLNGPFGNFTVTYAALDWQVHPHYVPGVKDFDLAVILTATPPPYGQYFSILEELNQSLPSPIIVCGYSAQSDDPAVTAAIDPNKQHLDADRIRTLGPNYETFQYNLQSLRGASGSPVYYAWGGDGEQLQMSVIELRVTGVHVSSYSSAFNQGCRLTQSKINWIHAVRRNYSAAAQSQSLGLSRQTSVRAFTGEQCFDLNWNEVELVPQPTGMSCWAAAAAMVVGWRDRVSINPEEIAKGTGRWAAFTAGLNPSDIDTLANAWGLAKQPLQSYSLDGFRGLLESYGPLWVGVAAPSGHAIVVTGMASDGAPDGSDTKVHILDPWQPGQGSRYDLPWSQFVQQYHNLFINNPGQINLQIIHAHSADGRQIGVSAQSMGFARQAGVPRAPSRPARAMAVVEIASAIAGATMTRILDNESDISWELDQLQGLKHIRDDAANAGSARYDTTTITIDGPSVSSVLGLDKIYADCELTFQHNGRSLGHIQIAVVRNSDAVGQGLVVKANIMNDANTYTNLRAEDDGSRFAAIKVRFHYTFSAPLQDDAIAITDVVLYGNGTHDLRFRWTQM